MKPHRYVTARKSSRPKAVCLASLAAAVISSATCRIDAAPNIVLWDTIAPTGDRALTGTSADWRAVPSDLLALEADPPKASSDPGFYGREYAFKGDAVVENRYCAAVFSSGQGRVVLYSKTDLGASSTPTAVHTNFGDKIAELVPLQTKGRPGRIVHCEIVRNANDEVVLNVSFSNPGSAPISARFSFGRNEIIEVKPAPEMKGISLNAPIDYGVVPSFIGDDLVFGPAEFGSANTLCLPSENLFLGLLEGESNELVMTWPAGKQQVKLQLGAGQKRRIESIEFDHAGQSFYLAVLASPGIWHKEKLTPAYLEKDVAIQWKRPFSARWQTQLTEAGVKTTFAFRGAKGQIWRGVPGMYSYPVWFDGETAFFRMSKKVPPKGEALIYFLEGQDTPGAISTPADILKATLGRSAADSILDVAGRKLRTHHGGDGSNVHRACTCGYTEAIQAVFEARQEVERKEFIRCAVNDMIYFVERHVARIEEYQRFAGDLSGFLQTQANASPELKPYLESIGQIADQIRQEYAIQKENMKSPAYMNELTQKTLALASRNDPKNLNAYLDLLKAWRGMGGAQDYVLAQCHVLTRKLFQEAGYGCVAQPKAVELAEAIRTRCRQILRNPDGYEIWANY